MEPAGSLKQLLEVYEKSLGLSLEKREELDKEVFRILVPEAYIISTVSLSPAFNGVVVVKNNFRNVPDFAYNSSTVQTPGVARPEQFFFKRE